MKRKRGVSFLLLLLGILLLQPPGLGWAATPAPPAISAQTSALIDVQSGRVLLEKDSTKRMKIASLTKIMTAIVAIENGNINDMVKTSNTAFGKEGSSIYLKRGEKLRLEDMLYGLMLRSGNDAAVAIAEHVGGSVEGFAHLMNEKARYIGMTQSHFTNP
ncbi:MAG TPA: D-alanyl-D-alanine carboxypeptidase, partial [Paenibacillaceae bacterium]|nr:D-alanyl-D-alanine carboxypeptidase [Paenibacillaceae bacterium]